MNNCDHDNAYPTGFFDTFWAVYVMWECDCGKRINIKITREQKIEIEEKFKEIYETSQKNGYD